MKWMIGAALVALGGGTWWWWRKRSDAEDASTSEGPMRTSDQGIAMIMQFETLQTEAYPDPGTGGDPWTIGFGHTGVDVYPGKVISPYEAEQLLRADVAKTEDGINAALEVPVTQGQFDALVSLAFNVGIDPIAHSTLMRKLNAGDVQGAADEFPKWNHAAGKVLPGLTRRRLAERELFLGGGVA